MKFLQGKYHFYLTVGLMFSLLSFGVYTAISAKMNRPYGSELTASELRESLTGALLILGAFIVGILSVVATSLRRSREDAYWITSVITRHLQQHANANSRDEIDSTTENSEQSPARWPWGNHHTDYLGHLEAAARRFWILYDPSDPTTAPTNETVSDWLQSDRNLSRERARAIASMLRPDGLPTGPRNLVVRPPQSQ